MTPEPGRYAAGHDGWFTVRCGTCIKRTETLMCNVNGGLNMATKIMRYHGWRMTGRSAGARWHCPACSGVERPVPVKRLIAEKKPRRPVRAVDERRLGMPTGLPAQPCYKCEARGWCEHRQPGDV